MMHDRATITAQTAHFLMMEVEARKLLKQICDKQMKLKMQKPWSRKRYGHVIAMIALRVSQYGAQRAYWERQAKRFTRKLNAQPHA